MASAGVTRRGHSIAEAGAIIGCCRSKIFSLIRTGQLKAHKVGSRTIILDASIADYLDNLPTVTPRGAAQ